jgi:hypothetical protein
MSLLCRQKEVMPAAAPRSTQFCELRTVVHILFLLTYPPPPTGGELEVRCSILPEVWRVRPHESQSERIK